MLLLLRTLRYILFGNEAVFFIPSMPLPYTEFLVFYSDFTTAEPSMEPRKESSAKSNTAVIAGAIVAVITLIVIIIVIACVLKKRKRKPLKLSKGFEGVHFTAVSMRDRIRAESMRALDESNVLSLFNPDDMKQLPLTSIEYVRDLGSGNFGLVFLGMCILDNTAMFNKNPCAAC